MLNLNTTALFFIAVMAPMAMLAGCGSGSDTSGAPSSSLVLSLTIVEGVDIDEVLWRVSGGDMEDMLGAIDTSAPGSTASVELFGVREGSGYLVEMEALSALVTSTALVRRASTSRRVSRPPSMSPSAVGESATCSSAESRARTVGRSLSRTAPAAWTVQAPAWAARANCLAFEQPRLRPERAFGMACLVLLVVRRRSGLFLGLLW